MGYRGWKRSGAGVGVKYEAVRGPRFVVEQLGGGEVIRIPASRSVPFLLFLAVWLVGWTAGGLSVIADFRASRDLFLGFWLCAWAAGVGFAGLMIVWMLVGAETLRVIHGDLENGWRIGPVVWRKLYQGARIQHLKAAPQNPMFAYFRVSAPFGLYAQFGAVQFDYGARTVRFAPGLDEAEARLIVERLLKSLPSAR